MFVGFMKASLLAFCLISFALFSSFIHGVTDAVSGVIRLRMMALPKSCDIATLWVFTHYSSLLATQLVAMYEYSGQNS